jgi:hypothetical protein
VGAPLPPPPGPTFGWWLHAAMQRQLRVVSLFSHAKPTWIHYIREGGAHLTTHNIILELHLTPHLVFFFIVLVVVFGASKSYLESLSPWKKELLGMNTMKSSSIFKLSSYSYSNAYELEYSCLHVIIMIYKLAYSLNVMILTCSTLCLIIHITCMSRIRVKLR